ncbi:Maltose O-acetyltransferase OS=Afipia felis OX=1035 GN=maa PE=4 SV=1 [Afipia felis]
MKSEKDKMLAGELYLPSDPEIQADSAATQVWLARYNAMLGRSATDRLTVLRERIAAGEQCDLRPPFHCDYGFNIRLGAGVFMNFNCVVLDVTHVTIGDRTQIGPAVQIYAADHPRDPIQRRDGFEFARPVAIGSDVWIGGGAIILPGVTIGDNALIGAGSVVTRDVAPGATVVGNPARMAARTP